MADIVDSHIIPKFQYKAMIEVDKRFRIISNNPNVKDRVGQKGFTERLLCASCDNEKIQRNESYFARFLVDRYHDLFNTVRETISMTVYDYKRIKNFLLSILWRMSVTTHPNFGTVKLGSKHNERLRNILLHDSEPDENEFPIIVCVPFINGKPLHDLIIPPDSHRAENNRIYRCMFSGLHITYIVGSAPLPTGFSIMTLRKSEWYVCKCDVEHIPYLNDYLSNMGMAIRLRKK